MKDASSEPVQLSRVIPYVFVRDVDAALAFYIDKLGFELRYRHENDPNCDMGIIHRGNIEMHVATCACEGKRHVGQAFFMIEVDDAPKLYEQYRGAGVPMHWELQRQPWGQTDFTIVDPEQNWITFVSDTQEEESS